MAESSALVAATAVSKAGNGDFSPALTEGPGPPLGSPLEGSLGEHRLPGGQGSIAPAAKFSIHVCGENVELPEEKYNVWLRVVQNRALKLLGGYPTPPVAASPQQPLLRADVYHWQQHLAWCPPPSKQYSWEGHSLGGPELGWQLLDPNNHVRARIWTELVATATSEAHGHIVAGISKATT